jgi:hypothetical protein
MDRILFLPQEDADHATFLSDAALWLSGVPEGLRQTLPAQLP